MLKMNTKHWGEIPKTTLNRLPDLSDDIKKAMDKFSIPELSLNEDIKPISSTPVILAPQDPLVTYAISLHRYMNYLNEINRKKVIQSEDGILPIPPLPEITLKHKRNCLNFISTEETDFTMGKLTVDIPDLTEEIVNKSLRKSICTLFAHLGYESTHESILNILVDVLKDFYRIFLKKLEAALHNQKVHNSSGFPHVIERVLVELGFGGIKGIHDYYQTRVIEYVNVLHKRCTKLKNQYENSIESQKPQTTKTVSVVKIEKKETDENPEVHLSEESEFSSLETGFQLLNRLEAETNFITDVNDIDMLTN